MSLRFVLSQQKPDGKSTFGYYKKKSNLKYCKMETQSTALTITNTTHYFSVSASVCFTSKPFTIFSMLFKSLGEFAVSGFGETVLGLNGGETELPLAFPEGELLKLRVCELGVTVSNALPSGEEPTGLGNV